MTYLEFYHLQEDPFGQTPDSFYFYPSKTHSDILACLDYAVEQREGFTMITGYPGTGKTTILRIFIDRWKEKADIALIMTPRLSGEELLQAILEDFQVPLTSANKNEMIKAFMNFLVERSQAGRRVLIIIDEAQILSPEALEELRLLSNMETEKEKLLQIILVGQPELNESIHPDRLKQLYQRITIRQSLRPLTADETADYLRYRLIKAGKGTAIFDDGAAKMIYRFSKGTPRLINLIASRAMMAAYISASSTIGKAHVQDAHKHITTGDSDRPFTRKIPVWGCAGLLLVTLMVVLYPWIQGSSSHQAASPLRKGPVAQAVTVAAASQFETPSLKPLAAVKENAVAVEKRQRQATISVGVARLRERPSLDAPTFLRAFEGQSFALLGQQAHGNDREWQRVGLPDGRPAWVLSRQVKILVK